jgi:hypothetical protein
MSNLGNGIQKNSARPIRVHVGDNGDYWLCDASVETNSDFAESGCISHSSVPMAEGG